MSSSTWEKHHKLEQMSPPDLYHPDHLYMSSEHGSKKKYNMDQDKGVDGYASPPSLPRDYSDQGSVKGYGSDVKSYHDIVHASHDGSLKDFVKNNYGNGGGGHRGDENYGNGGGGHRGNEHYGNGRGGHRGDEHYGNGGGDHRSDKHDTTRFSDSQNSSQHSSVKEFGSDHGSSRNAGDTRGSSDCRYNGSDCANNDIHQHSDNVSNPKNYVRLGMSWLDRRSFYIGEPCAIPLDWDHHPTLRQVLPDEHQNYRHAKLEEWLSRAHKRRSNEKFGAYIWRASALAICELRHRKKQCWGDEYEDPLDKFVMRLFYGMKLRLERIESIVLGVDDETEILNILREECDELNKNGQLPFDQRSIQYTPLIISEMQEHSSITRH